MSEHLPASTALEYTIHASSSFSGQYVPENILIDNPQDQRSRWSGGNGYTSTSGLSSAALATSITTPTSGANGPIRERQWLVLRLSSEAVLRQVTFGKYCRSHPCNVREFKIYAGLSPSIQSMSLVYWGGLKNDSVAETFDVTCKNKDGVVLPCRYICIEPLSAHSSNYNISIWHVSLHGNEEEDTVSEVLSAFSEFREASTNKLVLKHLRQRGLLDTFESLQRSLASTSAVKLEHPVLSQLHECLVQKGDFDAAESLLSEIAYPEDASLASLLDEYCSRTKPRVEWTRLDTDPDVQSWDGEAPLPRGGHQLVLVRPPRGTTSRRAEDEEDDAISIDAEDEQGDAALYLFGGWDGVSELSDFWKYSLRQQRWEFLNHDTSITGKDGDATGPSARSCHQMTVDESTGDIYLLGKFVDASRTIPTNTPPHIPAAPVAAEASPAGGPGRGTGGRRALGQEVSWTTITSASELGSTPPGPTAPPVFSYEAEAPSSSDFWVYHTRGPSRGRWNCLSPDTSKEGGPPLLFDHQMQIDPVERKLYVFGGKHYREGKAIYPGLYSYSMNSRTWEHIALRGATGADGEERQSIPPRTGHSMLFDPVERRLVILAGQTGETYLNDMWTYQVDSGEVKCVDTEYGIRGGPDGGFTQRATMDVQRREFVLLSGLVRDRSPPHHTNVKNSIWLRSLSNGDWRKVEHDSGHSPSAMDVDRDEPKARFAHQFVYDPAKDEHYLFGGNPADEAISARLGDFWRLKLFRTSKDEVLRRCKFLIRRCHFYEMCESSELDSMSALLYLQTSLASVAGQSDQAEFLACMSHLLATKGSATASYGTPTQAIWQQRTEVFEDVLRFFPEEAKQPNGNLVDAAVAWEGVL